MRTTVWLLAGATQIPDRVVATRLLSPAAGSGIRATTLPVFGLSRTTHPLEWDPEASGAEGE